MKLKMEIAYFLMLLDLLITDVKDGIGIIRNVYNVRLDGFLEHLEYALLLAIIVQILIHWELVQDAIMDTDFSLEHALFLI